jgi:hypothetical protein
MEKECEGCFLIRTVFQTHLKQMEPIEEEQISCEHDHRDCPCKTCLVKITCNQIEYALDCQRYVEFNIKYPHNSYWERIAKERENANQIQSSKKKNSI